MPAPPESILMFARRFENVQEGVVCVVEEGAVDDVGDECADENHAEDQGDDADEVNQLAFEFEVHEVHGDQGGLYARDE